MNNLSVLRLGTLPGTVIFVFTFQDAACQQWTQNNVDIFQFASVADEATLLD